MIWRSVTEQPLGSASIPEPFSMIFRTNMGSVSVSRLVQVQEQLYDLEWVLRSVSHYCGVSALWRLGHESTSTPNGYRKCNKFYLYHKLGISFPALWGGGRSSRSKHAHHERPTIPSFFFFSCSIALACSYSLL